MTWQPLSEKDLQTLICTAEQQMDAHELRLWHAIRIHPEKWRLPPWGDDGGGFWAVGILGSTVLWHNDIEEGFNLSPYTKYGIIDTYLCDQDELEIVVRGLLLYITKDKKRFSRLGPQ